MIRSDLSAQSSAAALGTRDSIGSTESWMDSICFSDSWTMDSIGGFANSSSYVDRPLQLDWLSPPLQEKSMDSIGCVDSSSNSLSLPLKGKTAATVPPLPLEVTQKREEIFPISYCVPYNISLDGNGCISISDAVPQYQGNGCISISDAITQYQGNGCISIWDAVPQYQGNECISISDAITQYQGNGCIPISDAITQHQHQNLDQGFGAVETSNSSNIVSSFQCNSYTFNESNKIYNNFSSIPVDDPFPHGTMVNQSLTNVTYNMNNIDELQILTTGGSNQPSSSSLEAFKDVASAASNCNNSKNSPKSARNKRRIARKNRSECLCKQQQPKRTYTKRKATSLKKFQKISHFITQTKNNCYSNRSLKLLVQKQLQPSDVSSLGRVVLHKREAEANLPTLNVKEGITMELEDMETSHTWSMRYRYWPNNKTRMYILENTGDFIKMHGLGVGDYLIIHLDEITRKKVIEARKGVRSQIYQCSNSENQSTSTNETGAEHQFTSAEAGDNNRNECMNTNKGHIPDSSNSNHEGEGDIKEESKMQLFLQRELEDIIHLEDI